MKTCSQVILMIQLDIENMYFFWGGEELLACRRRDKLWRVLRVCTGIINHPRQIRHTS